MPERAKSIFGVVGELCEDYSPVLAELRDPDFLDPASALKPAVKLFGQNEESWNAAYQVRVPACLIHVTLCLEQVPLAATETAVTDDPL